MRKVFGERGLTATLAEAYPSGIHAPLATQYGAIRFPGFTRAPLQFCSDFQWKAEFLLRKYWGQGF